MPNTNKWLDEIGLTYLVLKIKSLFNKKVDKVEGKGLSSEDYTTSEKIKLGSIENGAQVNKVTGVKGNSESSYRTGNINITKANIGLSNAENKSSETIRGEITEKNIIDALGYAPPKQDTTYVAATTTDAGLMSAADKTKLNGIATGANKYVHPTTSGNKHIPSGGSSGQILRWSADGTAAWGADNNTDTKVLQSVTTTGNYRPILMGANNNNDVSTLEESVTGQSYQSSKIYAQPSTGTFFVSHLTVRNDGNVTLTDGGFIYQKQPDPTTSRYSNIVRWVPTTTPTETYVAGIGRHNSGGDATDKGAITILPYNTSTTPWSGDVGLYIKKGYVSIDGNELLKKSVANSTYAAKSHTHSYLPLSGGTISSSTFGPLIIERTGSTNYAAIKFKNQNGILGSIGMNTVDGNIVRYKADSSANYPLLDTANFKTHVTPSAIGALPLTGGTMTGTIKYNSGTKTFNLFAIDDGDANGAMYTGPYSGGLTIIGAGESASSLRTLILSDDGMPIPDQSTNFTPMSEQLILSSDSNIYFMTNCNTVANRKAVVLTSGLSFAPTVANTGNIGTPTYIWNNMYATYFHGALDGNASSATKITSTVTDPTTATQYWVPFHDTGGTTGAKSLRHSKTMACHVMKGTTTKDGYTYFQVGNTTASGTDGNSYGVLRVCAKNEFYQNILPNTITANTNITLPASSGTLALTSSNITGTSAAWSTARTLTVNGSQTGSVSVKGNANMTLTLKTKYSFVGNESEDFESYSWHKFAETTCTEAVADRSILFTVSKTYNSVPNATGLLMAHIRTSSTKVHSSCRLKWIMAPIDVNFDDFVFVWTNTENTSCKCELWYKQRSRYDRYCFTVLSEFSRTNSASYWSTFKSDGKGSANHTTGTGFITSSLALRPMDAATSSIAGTIGYVPAPPAGAQNKFLRGDATWAVPTNTDTKVTVTDLTVNASTNSGIIRPILFAASNANPNNKTETVDGEAPNSSVSTTYTGGINMTGGLYVKTNYYTNGGSGGYVELHVPNGRVIATGFSGELTGTASNAIILKNSRKINGVSFNGSANISITKCLYSGTGATTVTLTESQSNYDLLIIVTNEGTFLHRVGTAFSFHSFNTFPTPSQNGTGYVNLYNFSINDQTDKKIIATTSKVDLKGSGTAATSNSTTNTVLIKEVYGLKLSAT